jgi:hypothetical protein
MDEITYNDSDFGWNNCDQGHDSLILFAMPVFLALANPYRKELKHENNLRPVHRLRGFRFYVDILWTTLPSTRV